MTRKIRSHSDELNLALNGGFGGFFELYGDEGVGKTGLLMSMFGHKKGVYVDLDGTFPSHMVGLMGNNAGSAIIRAPNMSKDDALSLLSSSAQSEADLIVFDPIGVWDDWAISDFAAKAHVICMQSGIHVGVANHCHAAGNSKGDISLQTYCHVRVEIRNSGEEMPNGMINNYRIAKNVYGTAGNYGTFTIDFEEMLYEKQV